MSLTKQEISNWIVGTLTAIVMALAGLTFANQSARLQALEQSTETARTIAEDVRIASYTRLAGLEAKVDLILQQQAKTDAQILRTQQYIIDQQRVIIKRVD